MPHISNVAEDSSSTALHMREHSFHVDDAYRTGFFRYGINSDLEYAQIECLSQIKRQYIRRTKCYNK